MGVPKHSRFSLVWNDWRILLCASFHSGKILEFYLLSLWPRLNMYMARKRSGEQLEKNIFQHYILGRVQIPWGGMPDFITMTEHWGNRQLRIWLGILKKWLILMRKKQEENRKNRTTDPAVWDQIPTGHLTEFFRVAISSRLVLSKSTNWWNAFHSASGIPLKMVRLLPAALWDPCPLPADIQEI